MSMSSKDRQDYNKLKEELLETCSMQNIRVGDMFWQLKRREGWHSHKGEETTSLDKKFIEQGMVEEAVDALVMEKLIQIISPTGAMYVRTNFRAAEEAARSAEHFFQDMQSCPDHPWWNTRPGEC